MYSLCSLEVFEDYQCHIQKKFGDTFSWGQFYFPLYQQNFIVFYCIFHTFSHFFLAAQDRLLNRSRGSLLFTWEICQKTTIFFFFSSFLRTFSWAPVMFEHYHFSLDSTLFGTEKIICHQKATEIPGMPHFNSWCLH